MSFIKGIDFTINNGSMNNNSSEPPFWQRIFDQPVTLLVAGLVVMFVFYTIWGLVEIFGLPQATLP